MRSCPHRCEVAQSEAHALSALCLTVRRVGRSRAVVACRGLHRDHDCRDRRNLRLPDPRGAWTRYAGASLLDANLTLSGRSRTTFPRSKRSETRSSPTRRRSGGRLSTSSATSKRCVDFVQWQQPKGWGLTHHVLRAS
eukprot:scaffold8536_cov248-Pinguiococcus_pyrenoidosus.AAC.6